jgi:hypothetical protein
MKPQKFIARFSLCCLSIFTFYSNRVSAQKPSTGFVIMNNNDTVHGKIISKGINTLHAIIMKIGNNEPQTFFPSTISGYVDNNGNIFAGAHLSYDVGPNLTFRGQDPTTMPYGIYYNPDNVKQEAYKDTAIYITQYVFVKALVVGLVSLYYFQDSTGRDHYFIDKNNVNLAELVHRRTYKRVFLNARDTMQFSVEQVENNGFRTQLLHNLGDCASIQLNDFSKLSYAEEDLVGIIRKYDLCKGKLLYVEKN